MKKERKDKYKDLLHNVGLKVTSDRLQILRILEKGKCPMSIYDINKKAKRTHLVTIYRFLEVLKNKGIVRQVSISDQRKHFEMVTTSHHHHIICKKCGFVEKINECAFDHVIRHQLRSCKKFKKITDHTFEIFGVCKQCG